MNDYTYEEMEENDMAGKQIDKQTIWTAISLIIMIGAHFVPGVGPITPLGMQVIGIFIGMIIGWSTCGMLVPSLLGILMLGLTEYTTSPEGSLGLLLTHNIFISSLAAFILLAYINDSGIMDVVSQWLVTRKFAAGKPWLFMSFFFVMIMVISFIFNPVVLILLGFSFMSPILKDMGYSKNDELPTYLFLGISIFTLATVAIPFLPSAIYTKGIASTALGAPVSNFAYFMCISVPLFAALVLYIIIGKFVLRIDTTKFVQGTDVLLKQIGDAKIKMTVGQKRGAIVLIVFVAALAIMALLPKIWAPIAFLNKFGLIGICVALVLVLLVLKDENGQPLTTFAKLINGVSWDMVMLTGAIMVIAGALTSQGTGIAQAMAMCGVIVSKMPTAVFVMAVMLVLCIFSQFSMNMVLQMVFAPILAPILASAGINPMIAVMAVYFGTQWAFLAPSGSMMAALVFGNTEWVNTKILYKCAIPWIILSLIVTGVMSLTFPNMFCPM